MKKSMSVREEGLSWTTRNFGSRAFHALYFFIPPSSPSSDVTPRLAASLRLSYVARELNQAPCRFDACFPTLGTAEFSHAFAYFIGNSHPELAQSVAER